MDPKSILFRGDDAERYVHIANNINADSMMDTLANIMTAVAASTKPVTLWVSLQMALRTLAINSLMFLLSFLDRATNADATPS